MSTSLLANMPYVNVRHQLPQIGIRQQQAMGMKNGFQPAEMHRSYQAPSADVSATQVEIDIDTYESRTSYGFLNNGDFARKYGQEGLQAIQSRTSRLASQNWDIINNAARSGGSEYNASKSHSDLFSKIVEWPQWTSVIPAPAKITVQPSEIRGQIDPGSDTYSIQPVADADIEIRTGSAETYMKDKGFINMWVTQGYIDTQA